LARKSIVPSKSYYFFGPKVISHNDPIAFRLKIDKHPEIDEHERKEITVETMSYFYVMIFNFLMDYFGPDQGLRLLEPVLKELGVKGALTNKERLRLRDDGPISIIECLDFIFNCLNLESELTLDEKNDRGEWKITSCPFSQSSVELCESFEIMNAKIVETLNPQMNGHHYQMMTKGAPFCRYVVERKEDFKRGQL